MNRLMKILISAAALSGILLVLYALNSRSSMDAFVLLIMGAGILSILLIQYLLSLLLYAIISEKVRKYIWVIFRGTFYLSVPLAIFYSITRIELFPGLSKAYYQLGINNKNLLLIALWIIFSAMGGVFSYTRQRKKELLNHNPKGSSDGHDTT
ncbi:MAG: hypothetical protein GY754_41595 [bacterium]|nr:hypothetical protein [bacterium]